MIAWINKLIILKNIGVDNNDKEVKSQISKAYNFWNKVIAKKNRKYFNFLLSRTTYFSRKKVKIAFEDLLKKEDVLNGNGLYLPLRHEERSETAVPLVYFIKECFKIHKDQIIPEKSQIWLKLLVKNLTQASSLEKSSSRYEEEINDNKKTIESLEQEIQTVKENGEYYRIKPLSKEITKKKNMNRQLEDKLQKIEKISELKKTLEHKNIVFIDDFLCSGKSASGFIEKNQREIKKLSELGYTFYLFFLSMTHEGEEKMNNTINKCFGKGEKIIKVSSYTTSVNINTEIKKKFKEDKTFNKEVQRINDIYNLKESQFNTKTALASFINSPNSNYAFFTQTGKNNKWIPAFPRENSSLNSFCRNQKVLKDLIMGMGEGLDE